MIVAATSTNLCSFIKSSLPTNHHITCRPLLNIVEKKQPFYSLRHSSLRFLQNLTVGKVDWNRNCTLIWLNGSGNSYCICCATQRIGSTPWIICVPFCRILLCFIVSNTGRFHQCHSEVFHWHRAVICDCPSTSEAASWYGWLNNTTPLKSFWASKTKQNTINNVQTMKTTQWLH